MKKHQTPIQELKKSNSCIELTLHERIIVISILPKQGSKLEQMIVRSLVKKFEFTKGEIKEFGIEYQNDFVKWNEQGKTASFNIELTDVEINILKEASRILDDKKLITQQNLSLVEKIDAM